MSSFLLLWFSPLLGLRPPATLWSRWTKKNLAPFSELSAVDPCSSDVLGLAREGPVAYAAKDIVESSTAGVVPTLAHQSPTLANSQLMLLQQLQPPQLQPLQLQPPQQLMPPQQLLMPLLQLRMPLQQPLMPLQQPLMPLQQPLMPPQLQLMPPQLQQMVVPSRTLYM